MKKYIIILTLFPFFFSCSEEPVPHDTICNVTDPVNELSWLIDVIEETQEQEYGSIEVSFYETDSLEYIYVDYCKGCLGYNKIAYNCSGEETFCYFCIDSLRDTSAFHVIYTDTSYIKDESICNSEEPLSEFSWLQDIIRYALEDENDSVVIKQCIIEDTEGYIVERGAREFRVKNLYNCEGDLVRRYDGVSDKLYDYSEFQDKIFFEKLLFTDTIFTPTIIEKYLCTEGNPVIELSWLKEKCFPRLELFDFDPSGRSTIYQGYFDGIAGFRIKKNVLYSLTSDLEYVDCEGNTLHPSSVDINDLELIWNY